MELNTDNAIDSRTHQLQKLARDVVDQVKPNSADREGADDCFQQAFIAGLQACRSADRSRRPTSNEMIFLAMRQAVYRMLHRAGKALREADFITVQ